jgi:hypothetical protein
VILRSAKNFWESETTTRAEVTAKEMEFIRLLRANDSAIVYNHSTAFRRHLPFGYIFVAEESGLRNANAIERQQAHVDNNSSIAADARAGSWEKQVRIIECA